jgi:heptosyltransferase III
MSTFKSSINVFRRTVLHKLTSIIGTDATSHIKPTKRETVKNVLIIRPNHRLGNQLLITPLIQDIQQTFPACSIDLFTGRVATILLKNYPGIDRIITIPRKPFKDVSAYLKAWLALRNKKYDIVFNAITNSSSGKLATRFTRSANKLYGEMDEDLGLIYSDYEHYAKNPVYNFRHYVRKMGIDFPNKPIPNLSLKLNPLELEAGEKIVLSLIDVQKPKTICLYTYATGDKCYTASWWEAFYTKLLVYFPTVNFIELLPVENISMIDFKAPSFYSKDVRQMGAILANTQLYLGADCGIMHLASAAGTTTLGLFSETKPEMYGPYNGKSFGISTTNLSMDDLLKLIEKLLNQA